MAPTPRQPTPSGERPRIAVIAEPDATILNAPALVTTNAARRAAEGPPPAAAATARRAALRPQRLPQSTLPASALTLRPRTPPGRSQPPDGYIAPDGTVRTNQASASDCPAYRVTLNPDDGLYLLPYVARRADGSPWDSSRASQHDDPATLQTFLPDASRLFEEVDRSAAARDGHIDTLSSQASFAFYRVAPPADYTNGLSESCHPDIGSGDIPPEVQGRDFFPYTTSHAAAPSLDTLALITNQVADITSKGRVHRRNMTGRHSPPSRRPATG